MSKYSYNKYNLKYIPVTIRRRRFGEAEIMRVDHKMIAC